MSENTKIEWADHTFNPWEGCQKVGPGCDHCYAEARNARFGGGTAINWGPHAPRRRTSVSNWNKPIIWNSKPFYQCEGCGWRGHDACLEGGSLTTGLPSCPSCDDMRLKLVRPRVFCASLADVFDNAVDPQWRVDLFKLIRATPNIDWLLVTKRVGNATFMIADALINIDGNADLLQKWPWPNVWIGATIVNQDEADRDIPKLLNTPAAVRFLSMEPLLGQVDISEFLRRGDAGLSDDPMARSMLRQAEMDGNAWVRPALDWVIVGGESGFGARPMHPNWLRLLRDQCAGAGVPLIFKQWGEYVHQVDAHMSIEPSIYLHQDGRTATEKEALAAGGSWAGMFKPGKHIAGRKIDGEELNGYPK